MTFSRSLYQTSCTVFQDRFINKFLTFTHSILNNQNTTTDLRKELASGQNVNILDDESEPELEYFNLSNGALIKNRISNTIYENLTFKYFFSKLINKFSNFNFFFT